MRKKAMTTNARREVSAAAAHQVAQVGPGGPGGGDREALVKEFDENEDGKLDDGERKKARAEMQKRFEKRGEERFKQQDTNNDGVLSLVEFKEGNNRLGDRADEIYSRLNTDGKEGLTKEELAKGRQAHGPRGERPGLAHAARVPKRATGLAEMRRAKANVARPLMTAVTRASS